MLRADVSTQEQEYIKDRCVISRKEKLSLARMTCLADKTNHPVKRAESQ